MNITQTPNRKGTIAELAVSQRYLELGYWVSVPVGDDAAYDLVVDMKDKGLKKVQVKHVKVRKGVLTVRFNSTTGQPYKGVVDYIAIYEPYTGQIYQVDPEEFSNSGGIYLRLEPSKNRQQSKVHLAEKYLLVGDA